MDKWTVARTLDEIAQYIELNDPNRFKSRAFERAARAVESIAGDLGELIAAEGLYGTSGIGKAIGPIIIELAETGQSRYLKDLRSQYPPGIFDMLRVPGLGLKKIGELYSTLGIASLDALEAAGREGKLAKLRGFGTKTQTKILEGIEVARRRESKYLLPTGLEVGERMREHLAAIDSIEDAEVVGSVRRRLEVIRNVNLAIATRDFDGVKRSLMKLVDKFEEVDERTCRGVAHGEMDVWFHLARPDDFGATVVESTGSSEFVEELRRKIVSDGYEIRDGVLLHGGRHVKAPVEDEVFQKTGVPALAPERRESGADLARKKRVRLVEPTDLRGTFHVHTTYSDGRNTMLQMLEAARDRGLDYVGISDHSKAAYYARGLSEERLVDQHAEIDEHRAAVRPMRVFRGSEADILPDGSIDYGPQTLDLFDFVVASIHSRFDMQKDAMTERILKALDDPHVTFIGHLTGRKLLARDGYTVDFDRIFEKAAERGVMMEINGNPNRLDVDWRHLGRARDLGVIFGIHPDAHSIREMSHVISGTWVARKAGLSAKEIFNTKPLEEVTEWLEARKKKARLSSRA